MENINFVLFCFERELWVLLSPLLIKAISAFTWRGQTNSREQRKGPEGGSAGLSPVSSGPQTDSFLFQPSVWEMGPVVLSPAVIFSRGTKCVRAKKAGGEGPQFSQ